MSVDIDSGKHIPKDPDKFVFDEEVAPIFDNMSVRSLPGYDHCYALMTSIMRDMEFKPNDQVWDFGVSTGKGLISCRDGIDEPLVDYWGCDVSEPMLKIARAKCPWGRFQSWDFETTPAMPFTDIRQMKVAIWGWTLQFLKNSQLRQLLLKKSYDLLEPGGVLFLMEKWSDTCGIDEAVTGFPATMQREYLKFRRGNGYTAQEIVAKSSALKHSMWPWSRAEAFQALYRSGFEQNKVFGLYQMYNFGGLIAFK